MPPAPPPSPTTPSGPVALPKSGKARYRSAAQVRWCSGCGDYHVLNALTSAWDQCGIPKENIALISGIGCSSRLPYYASTYGFHTIHGRAPTIAMGLHIARPELSVWVVTGDGDGLSIGGGHLMHICRRNPNLTILLFNNEIYGLTKGQASPTSAQGLKTRSTPQGSLEPPMEALPLAITHGATFVARVVDTDLKGMRHVFQQAHAHQGLSFIEIYTNCVIFNDGAFADVEKRHLRKEHAISLSAGQPLLFGAQNEKALIWEHFDAKIIPAAELSTPAFTHHRFHHNPETPSPAYAFFLAKLRPPQYPLPLGIFRQIRQPTYGALLTDQQRQRTPQNLTEILRQEAFQPGKGGKAS